VAINDVTVDESAGTAVFTVTLTGAIQDALTVDFATSNGTALTPGDYLSQSGTVTFAAGSASGATQTITITITDDLISEPTETFNVLLSNLVYASTIAATITDDSGLGTIIDDDIADLAITKTSSPDPVIIGNNITYTISVVNLGSNIASEVTVEDILPAGLTFVSASATSGTWDLLNSEWVIGQMLVGGTATMTLVASVDGSVIPGTVITNTATVSSITTDPDPANNTSSVSNHTVPVVTCSGDVTVCYNALPFALNTLGGFTPAGGVFTGTGVSGVNFDPAVAGTGTHTITYTYTLYGYTNSCSFGITVDPANPITLSGQVRYFNSAETFMQTPFQTDINNTRPPDYFYVALYESTDVINPANPLANAKEWEKVDIVNTEIFNNQTGEWEVNKDMTSYFEFSYPMETSKQYYVTVWDGGNVYQEFMNLTTTTGNVYNPELGSSYTWNNWGGVSALDALGMQYMVNGAIQVNSAPYNWNWIGDNIYSGAADLNYGFYSNYIANVNTSANGITALDALTTQYRVAGLQPTFPNNTPNYRVAGRFVETLPKQTWHDHFDNLNPVDISFVKSSSNYTYFSTAIANFYKSNSFNSVPFSIAKQTSLGSPVGTCPDYGYINIYYTATGDVNASYIPPSPAFKGELATVNLAYDGEIAAQKGEEVLIPVRIDRGANLGAITLGMTYRNDLIKVVEIPEYEVANINHEEGTVRMAWADQMGKTVSADEVIIKIKAIVLSDIEPSVRLFELENMTELGTVDAERMYGVTLKTDGLNTKQSGSSDIYISNYPNPVSTVTTFEYKLPESGKVELVLYNKLGQIVRTLVDKDQNVGLHTLEVKDFDLAPGVYTYRLTLNGEVREYSVAGSMIVLRK